MGSKNESDQYITDASSNNDPGGDSDQSFVSRKESVYLGVFLALVSALTVFDIIEDSVEGVPLYHIIPECLTAIIAFFSAGYLFYIFVKKEISF